jgi:hypothetical protein
MDKCSVEGCNRGVYADGLCSLHYRQPHQNPIATAQVAAPAVEEGLVSEVKICDFDMPFWNLVCFMVKVAIASIPALVILAILAAAASAMFGGIVGALK